MTMREGQVIETFGEARHGAPSLARLPGLSLLCVSLAILSSCATSGVGNTVPQVVPAVAQSEGRESFSELDVSGYRIVKTYAAASGRTCRRLADENGTVLSRVSCQRADGTWTVGRYLGTGPAPSVVPAPSALVPAVPASETEAHTPAVAAPARTPGGNDLVWVKVDRDETLWAFAGRLTGNPQNWRRIAALNDIDDATTLESGRWLAVPVSIATGKH